MFLEMITPAKQVYAGEIQLIQLPGIDGSFEILNSHVPMIAILGEGKIKIIENQSNKEDFFSIKGGVVEVHQNKVVVLAE